MLEYFCRVREVVNQIRTYDETITSQKITEKILTTLPEKYNPIVLENTQDMNCWLSLKHLSKG